MLKTILPLFFVLVFSLSKAQTEELIVKSNSKGSYVEHKVTAKENFYSIGRLFNVHPKHLASFNSVDMSKGLALGQILKIPLSDTNFTHKSEMGTPVYYITSDGETVYNVSTNNSVLMEKLRKWNKIPADKLPAGSKLVVGYLVTASSQALAVNAVPKTNIAKATTVEKPVKDEAGKQTGITKEEGKKEVEQKKPVNTEDLVQVNEQAKNSSDEGYFKAAFNQQVVQQPLTKEQTVTSGTFKTSSGWSDSKYYILMDGADPGTIVRITNPGNNKVIYAKLLGGMSDLKQNDGPGIRISNAAASALAIADTDKFIVKLNY